MVKNGRRAIHEWINIQIHCFQWWSSTILGERFCLLSNEVCCGIHLISLPCEGSERSSCCAQACFDNIHEAWVEGKSCQAWGVQLRSSIVYVKTYMLLLSARFVWVVEIWESVEGKDGVFFVYETTLDH